MAKMIDEVMPRKGGMTNQQVQALHRAGIRTYLDLAARTEKDLVQINNFGRPGIAAAERQMKLLGLILE